MTMEKTVWGISVICDERNCDEARFKYYLNTFMLMIREGLIIPYSSVSVPSFDPISCNYALPLGYGLTLRIEVKACELETGYDRIAIEPASEALRPLALEVVQKVWMRSVKRVYLDGAGLRPYNIVERVRFEPIEVPCKCIDCDYNEYDCTAVVRIPLTVIRQVVQEIGRRTRIFDMIKETMDEVEAWERDERLRRIRDDVELEVGVGARRPVREGPGPSLPRDDLDLVP